MKRGEIWWATLRTPRASEPRFRRPVLVVQSDVFNESRIRTVLAVVVTSDLRLAEAPGNIRLSAKQAWLPKPSVANVSQVVTLDKSYLTDRVGELNAGTMKRVDAGIRLVLALR